jgi:rod shape-determining protein MreC
VRGRKYALYFAILLAVVILLNLPLAASVRIKAALRDGLSPFLNGLTRAAVRLRVAGAALTGASSGEEERRHLLQQVAELKVQVMRLNVLERDNAELRRQVGFAEQQRQRLVLCDVLARGDASGWWQKITLNRGARHGIRPDLPVVTTEGLVGRTMAVSAYMCDVLLITDPNCKVACQFADRNTYGIVRGMGITGGGEGVLEMLCAARPCRLDYVPRDEVIAPGTDVRTSGLGGVYPEGLRVGRVLATRLDPAGLYQCADIAPAADLAALKYVFVMVSAQDAPAAEPRRAAETGDERARSSRRARPGA